MHVTARRLARRVAAFVHRPVVGIVATAIYLAQIAGVVARLACRGGWDAAFELVDSDGFMIFMKVVVVIVMAILGAVYHSFVWEFLTYEWNHDRVSVVKMAILAGKAVVTLAGLGAVACFIIIVVAAAVVAPAFVLAEILRAWVRGLGVAIRAFTSTTLARTVPDVPANPLPPLLIQLSDLHIAAPGQEPYEIEVEPESWPAATRPTSEELRARLRRLLNQSATTTQGPIVLTGDLTDTGAWSEWAEIIADLRPFRERLVLAPGNHDISINRSAAPDYEQEKRTTRQSNFLRAAKTVSEIAPDASYEGLFPLRKPLDRGATLFVLDSNRYPSRYVLSNAVGLHGDNQLQRLERELGTTHGPVVVATHHHPAKLAGEFFTFEDAYMIAVDGRRLLRILAKYRKRAPANTVLVIHGHRHLSMYGRSEDGVLVCGHPSSTLGQSSRGQLDCTSRYASIHLDDHGEWFVATHRIDDESHADAAALGR